MKYCTDVTYDDVGRVYVYNDSSRYYSVTTMLGATSDKSSLLFWKKRVGAEEAKRVCEEASDLGEQYHSLGENYLLNKPLPVTDRNVRRIFSSTIDILAANVTKVRAVECPLVCEKYKLAGRVDAVVEWNNTLAILDFKLLNDCSPHWLTDYWLQTTIYAKAWEEMYGESPKKCILVTGSKTENNTKFFTSNPSIWLGKVHRRVSEFQRILDVQQINR